MATKLLVSRRLSDTDLARIRSVPGAFLVEQGETLEEAIARAADAEVVFAGRWSDDLWKAAPRLRWVQSGGAGVERFLTPDFIGSSVVLTNAAGVYAIPIAEHVIALVLAFARGLHRTIRSQMARQWEYPEVREVVGSTLGVVGLGAIGTEVARRAKGLGMRVLAVRRRPDRASEFADAVRGADALPWLLAESDHIALCAALTHRTRHLIGEAELKVMKPTSYLINIGRGGLIDEPALISALQSSAIAGAGLDVFAQEPLPADSPLWDMPNVIITPHHAGDSPHSHDRLMALFCENLRRYLAGEELLNVVDKKAGY
jgi:phosphoglycerate dehydrogenase-like enzyme